MEAGGRRKGPTRQVRVCVVTVSLQAVVLAAEVDGCGAAASSTPASEGSGRGSCCSEGTEATLQGPEVESREAAAEAEDEVHGPESSVVRDEDRETLGFTSQLEVDEGLEIRGPDPSSNASSVFPPHTRSSISRGVGLSNGRPGQPCPA